MEEARVAWWKTVCDGRTWELHCLRNGSHSNRKDSSYRLLWISAWTLLFISGQSKPLFSFEIVQTVRFMSYALSFDAEIFWSKFSYPSSTVYLYAQNDPIIESSDHLTFAPYNLSYPHLIEQMTEAGLDPHQNWWDVIFDFTEK